MEWDALKGTFALLKYFGCNVKKYQYFKLFLMILNVVFFKFHKQDKSL